MADTGRVITAAGNGVALLKQKYLEAAADDGLAAIR